LGEGENIFHCLVGDGGQNNLIVIFVGLNGAETQRSTDAGWGGAGEEEVHQIRTVEIDIIGTLLGGEVRIRGRDFGADLVLQSLQTIQQILSGFGRMEGSIALQTIDKSGTQRTGISGSLSKRRGEKENRKKENRSHEGRYKQQQQQNEYVRVGVGFSV
jgi:hypothetical protein